jgi:hypothetical protein
MNNILYNGTMRVENHTKTRVYEDSSLCPETLIKNAVQEFPSLGLIHMMCIRHKSYRSRFMPDAL